MAGKLECQICGAVACDHHAEMVEDSLNEIEKMRREQWKTRAWQREALRLRACLAEMHKTLERVCTECSSRNGSTKLCTMEAPSECYIYATLSGPSGTQAAVLR